MTLGYLLPLWCHTGNWHHAPGVCSVTGVSWWKLHSSFIKIPLSNDTRVLHNIISERFLYLIWTAKYSVQFLIWASPHLTKFWTWNLSPQYRRARNFFVKNKQLWENTTSETQLIYPEECRRYTNVIQPNICYLKPGTRSNVEDPYECVLTYCGQVASLNLVNIGSGNGLLPDGTQPFPEPMFTDHWWGLVAFTWEQFYRKCSRYLSLMCVWKLIIHV